MAKNFQRAALIRSASFDADANTIEVIWSTGAAVRRFDWWSGEEYDEVLSLDPGAVRLDRLNAGAPFLAAHQSDSLSSVIGSVVKGSARIENARGVATILLSPTKADADTVQKIAAGIIRNISVGYWQHKVVKTESDGGTVARWDVIDWEPLEISAVPIPADAGAQIRGAAKSRTTRAARIRRYARMAGLQDLGEQLIRRGASSDAAFMKIAGVLDRRRDPVKAAAGEVRALLRGSSLPADAAYGRREAELLLRPASRADLELEKGRREALSVARGIFV